MEAPGKGEKGMSYIDIYRQLQKQLMEPYKLCEIDVETITPLLIGGYDGKTYHDDKLGSESLRAASIKGVWRWWARALIAAAMVKKHGKCPRYLNVVDSYVSKIFGSTQEQSKYSIAVTPQRLNKSSYDVIERLSDVPRIKLLREMRRERFIKPGIRFKITVYRTRDTNPIEDQFAVWSLITSLIFDGVGKATSRGFGKLKINRINVRGDFMELEEVIRKLYSSNSHKDIENHLKEVINYAINSAEKFEIDDKYLSSTLEPSIEIPLIDERLMILEIPRSQFRDYISVLKVIGNASLKLYYKAIRYVKKKISIYEAKRRSFVESGKNIHTWILGLPRSQELPLIPDHGKKIKDLRKKLENELEKLNLSSEVLLNRIEFDKKRGKIKVPTGYYYLMGRNIKLRRRSPIRFTTIKTNSNYFFTVIYAFKTADWKERIRHLVHIGVNYKKIDEKIVEVENFEVTRVRDISIDDVINTIVHIAKEIIECIGEGS